MAPSISNVYNISGLFASNTYSTNNFTPPNNCLLVVFVAIGGGASTTIADPTISGGGLTWTKQASALDNSRSSYPSGATIFTAPVTTGALMSLTLGQSASNPALSVHVNAVTGYNTSSPVGATATGTSLGNGAISITLSGTPSSSSLLFAGIQDFCNGLAQTGITEGSGWTIRNAFESVQAFQVNDATQYRTGTTSTTVPWQQAVVGDAYYTQAAAAIEIQAAPQPPAGEYDRWEFKARSPSSAGTPVGVRGDFWPFSVPPSLIRPLKDFDQWTPVFKARPKPSPDWSGFRYTPQRFQPLSGFEPWQGKTRRPQPGPDFVSQANIAPANPPTPKLSEYDRWEFARPPKITQTELPGFVYVAPPIVPQPLLQFDQWAVNWHNLVTPTVQRDQFWQFGRLDQPPEAPQPLRRFDQWDFPRSAKALTLTAFTPHFKRGIPPQNINAITQVYFFS